MEGHQPLRRVGQATQSHWRTKDGRPLKARR